MNPEDLYTPGFLAKLQPDRSSVHQFLNAIYNDQEGREEWALRQLARLNECFDLASRYGLDDEDFRRRLLSPDPAQLWGKLNELTAARRFDRAGIQLDFAPLEPGRRIGEFLLDLAQPIFVEVKTMLPRAQDSQQSRYIDVLCGEIRKVDVPLSVTLTVDELATHDFRLAPFGEFLKREFTLELGQAGIPVVKRYHDKRSGLLASVSLSGLLTEGPMDVSPLIGPVELANDQYVRATLEKAAEQLPTDKPCLVLLFEKLTFPLRLRTILNALYGSLSVVIGPPGTPGVWTRKGDGVLRPGQHTRVTAVGCFDDSGEKGNPEPDLQLYFHPEPRIALKQSDLAMVSTKQVVPVVRRDNGTKHWELTQPHEQFI